MEVRTEGGGLSAVTTWWNPGDGLEGRWWRDETGGGSAWVGIGGFQAGPLKVYRGAEGLKTWGPRSDLPAGSWGLGFDNGSWGLWAVQEPGTLEAGAQARASWDYFALAGGVDRTWGLAPGTEPWTDRGRVGLTWNLLGWDAGLEAGAEVAGNGPPLWSGRGRWSWSRGPWESSVRWTGGPDNWTGTGRIGWGPWAAGWAGNFGDPWGRGDLGWALGPGELRVSWGPARGWEFRSEGSWPLGSLGLDLKALVRQAGPGWSGRAGASLEGDWAGGGWSAGWTLTGGGSAGPVQTVTAGWRGRNFEAEGRWRTEGLRLGWLGPGAAFSLVLRCFF